jgi:hypothetical protein
MATMDLTSYSGESFSIGGQITRPAAIGQAPPWPNYPGSAAGYTLTFTAKDKKADATPVVQRDNTAGGNVTLGNGGAWTVKLLSADTAGFTKTRMLIYEVTLEGPAGEATVVAEGTWKVEKSTSL